MSYASLSCVRVSALALCLLLGACGPGPVQRPPALDVTLQSQRGVSSHEAGNNCMACHQEEGLGKGRFTVAGTAYSPDGSPHTNATVSLFVEGEAVVRLETDAAGNFYTTEPVDFFGRPVFPLVERAGSDESISMPFPTNSGACNMCHVGRQHLTLD